VTTWQQARDERARRSVAPHLALLEQHGWRCRGMRWERLRGHRVLLARPDGVTEYWSVDQLAGLAADVAKGGA